MHRPRKAFSVNAAVEIYLHNVLVRTSISSVLTVALVITCVAEKMFRGFQRIRWFTNV